MAVVNNENTHLQPKKAPHKWTHYIWYARCCLLSVFQLTCGVTAGTLGTSPQKSAYSWIALTLVYSRMRVYHTLANKWTFLLWKDCWSLLFVVNIYEFGPDECHCKSWSSTSCRVIAAHVISKNAYVSGMQEELGLYVVRDISSTLEQEADNKQTEKETSWITLRLHGLLGMS